MVDNKDSKPTTFHSVSGLWNGRGKVAYTGNTRQEVTIPKGAKLLVFVNPNATPANRQPAYNLVYVVEDKQ